MSKLANAALATILLLHATPAVEKGSKIRPLVGRLMAQELDTARALARKYITDSRKAKRTPLKLKGLRDQFADAVGTITDRLHAGNLLPAEWEDEFSTLLARYHQAGYMVGARQMELSPKAYTWVGQFIDSQLDYLSSFRMKLQDDAEWQVGWDARAEMYADAIKVPYWKGETKMLPLPAMPAEGTQCLNNCGCSWRIEPIDDAAGDYDCYWERSKDDSCQTCLEREGEWNPLRIRGNDLE